MGEDASHGQYSESEALAGTERIMYDGSMYLRKQLSTNENATFVASTNECVRAPLIHVLDRHVDWDRAVGRGPKMRREALFQKRADRGQLACVKVAVGV